MNVQFEKRLNAFIAKKAEKSLLRERGFINYKINFATNDYLGLASDPIVRQAFVDGFMQYPIGSTGSALIAGYHPIHQELEYEFAKTLQRDAAILFPSAYAANLAIMLLLKTIEATILLDKSCHASIYDGVALAKINNFNRFLHNNLDSLENKLQSIKQPCVIITESLFSMSGQYAPVPEILKLAKQYDAQIILDEAHAFGCTGDRGLGIGYQYPQAQIPLLIIGFGKAMGGQGAVVAGQSSWIQALLQVARPYIYSTAISPAYSYGLLKSFKYLQTLDARRITLQQNIKYFRENVCIPQHTWQNSISQIQALKLGSASKSQALSDYLRQQGIYCPAIRTPTVALKDSGLRIVLRHDHTPQDLHALGSGLEFGVDLI